MSKLIDDLKAAAPVLKYFAAHAAGFGSLAMALFHLATGDVAGAIAAALTAAAAFGLNVKPAANPTA